MLVETFVALCYYVKYFYMKIIDQFAIYLFLKKKDKNVPKDKYLGLMHGMNRISVFVFLIALIIILFKQVIIPLFK